MPVYDYVCSACGRVTEVIHGINAEGPRFCPACGAEATLRKGFTTPAVHFKGTGWAKKDRASSASKHASARSDTDAKVDAGSKASSDDSGASKPATDGDSTPSTSSKDRSTESSDKTTDAKSSTQAGAVERPSRASKLASGSSDRGGD